MINTPISRRKLLETAALTAVGAALLPAGGAVAGLQELPLITKPIPSSGEVLPVIGIGTNQFGTDDPQALARIRTILQQLPKLGGEVIDTAQAYGNSEAVIGRLVEDIGNRDQLFLATKTATRGDVAMADIDAAFERLGSRQIDLLQVHNFNQTDGLLPKFLQLKSEGRIRYVGCSTSSDRQYADLKAAMAKYPLDFIQVDYSIDNRTAAREILPMAADNGIAVLGNVPFGGRRNAASMFARVAEVQLPDWAAQIDVSSWAQFFLKYVVSHPAITVSIPGTTKPHHLEDNLGAARGRLPDAHMRQEMERYWDEI